MLTESSLTYLMYFTSISLTRFSVLKAERSRLQEEGGCNFHDSILVLSAVNMSSNSIQFVGAGDPWSDLFHVEE